MARTLEPVSYQIKKVELKTGRRLAPGEKSLTGLYGLVSNSKGRLLRVALNPEVAEALCDENTRHIVECSIIAKSGGEESVS